MKSNVTVGPPIDLLAYSTDELEITRHRTFSAGDPDLNKIRIRWEQALRQAVLRLPQLRFQRSMKQEQTIQLVDVARTDSSAPESGQEAPQSK